ncbi:hypothetical protein VE04_00489 [Pseudogymnoascus sp. 24MN13]|nr:hypothetical protein VE04_00489 [Pseudogymnoascus sp. 24MN13]
MATSPSSDSSLLGELCGADSSQEPQWWLCKKESHDRNAAQLNSERTTVIKGI